MLTDSFFSRGFEILSGLLNETECEVILGRIADDLAESVGLRSLLSFDWCADLAARLRETAKVRELVPADYIPAQCTYFAKSAARNWLVPFHQDLSIPVAERVEASELRGWSAKEGTLFVQPPPELLEGLVALRLHLDPCGPLDGPLQVVPGSHRQGRIDPSTSEALRQAESPVSCIVERGGALLLRPLLLHASSKATGTSRRRVLHFLFGPRELPYGLRWHRAAWPSAGR